MKNTWEVWTRGISEQYCDYIVNKARSIPEESATIGFDDTNRSNSAYRSSTIKWLDVFHAHSDIAETIMRLVRSSNRTNFGFDITSLNEIQYTTYRATQNGKYDWHNDVYWQNPMPYDRKLSIVVQLSDPKEYDGADFEFFNIPSPTSEQWGPRGSVLIFPSFIEHRVKPITRGTRTSLVSWIEGPKWR